ncbi:hypothetical protein [Plesiocystis pacifica]|nr:hypothetical protein [Plesiocystis pacifica]
MHLDGLRGHHLALIAAMAVGCQQFNPAFGQAGGDESEGAEEESEGESESAGEAGSGTGEGSTTGDADTGTEGSSGESSGASTSTSGGSTSTEEGFTEEGPLDEGPFTEEGPLDEGFTEEGPVDTGFEEGMTACVPLAEGSCHACAADSCCEEVYEYCSLDPGKCTCFMMCVAEGGLSVTCFIQCGPPLGSAVAELLGGCVEEYCLDECAP